MEKIGKLIICDCCHKEIFLEQLKSKGIELDGGYTRSEIFIAQPEEWYHILEHCGARSYAPTFRRKDTCRY